jgi:hypothetical protein
MSAVNDNNGTMIAAEATLASVTRGAHQSHRPIKPSIWEGSRKQRVGRKSVNRECRAHG